MSRMPMLGYRRALVNNKGGVGKTALTVELAAALARRGRTVLVVDLDPQGNATRRLGATVPGLPTLADVLHHPGEGEGERCLRPCGWQAPYAAHIHVLAASLSLEDRVLEAGLVGAVRRLRRALYGVSDNYDWTLIDCPPSMGHLTQMAVAALDGDQDAVLIPIEPEHDAITGALRAVALIDEWADDLVGHEVRVDGILVNGVRAQTALHQIRLEDLASQFRRRTDPETGDPVMIPVWWPHIPLTAALAEVHDQGAPADSDRRLVHAGIVGRLDHIARHLDVPLPGEDRGDPSQGPVMATAVPGGDR